MANIVVIDSDQRVQTQIRQFIQSMESSHTLRFFKSAQEFHEKFFAIKPESEDSATPDNSKAQNQPPEESVKRVEVLGTVHLVIFNSSSLGGPYKPWLEQLRTHLQERAAFPEENVTRFMALKFEDDGVDNSDFYHPHVDDLVCLPLDRLLFLQKVEILLALPKKISPGYLYNQEVRMPIEISKKTKLKFLGDFGLAILNPVPLTPGVVTHFYFRLPDQKEMNSLFGKVLKSQKEDNGKSYIVYFTFFGLSRELLKRLKTYFAKIPNFKPFGQTDLTQFKYQPKDTKASFEQMRKKVIAVIDVDPNSCGAIKNQILEGMERVEVLTECSYYLFSKQYLAQSAEVSDSISINAVADDFFSEQVSWKIDLTTKELRAPPEKLEEKSKLFGHPALQLFGSPTGWQKIVDSKDTTALMGELYKVLESRGTATSKVEFSHLDGSFRAAQITMRLVENKRDIIIALKALPPSTLALQPKTKPDEKANVIDSLDMVIINAALVPAEIIPWIESLNQLARSKGLCPEDGKVKVVLVSEESPKFAVNLYRDLPIDGLLYKPIETQRLQFLTSTLLDCPYTLCNFSNVKWLTPNIPVYVSKPATVESISEYGVTLNNEKKLAVGTVLYFHGGIFDHDLENIVCGRVYRSDESEKEKGAFSCYFTYFGINDLFLKFTRKWIRTNYAQKKSAS